MIPISISQYNTCHYLFSERKATQVEELPWHPTLPSPLAGQAEPKAEALPSILALMFNQDPLAQIEHTLLGLRGAAVHCVTAVTTGVKSSQDLRGIATARHVA